MTSLSLTHVCFGEGGPPVLIVHGLLGSSRNWQGVAQALAEDYRVAVPDLRNHGASPHSQAMSYREMAEDLAALLDRLHWPAAHVIGHSMGGKAAMYLAMSKPERVLSLLVADIAPAAYPDRHSPYLDAMESLLLDGLPSRAAADARLAAAIPHPAVRLFLLQNLVSTPQGYRWRANLKAIRANLSAVLAPPQLKELPPYPGETLFLTGADSDYVQADHHPVIGHCFPRVRIRTLHGAGHWLHVDQPGAFLQIAREFLSDARR